MQKTLKKVGKWVRRGVQIIFLLILVLFVTAAVQKPQHDRDWELGQGELPRVTFGAEGEVTIHNLRDFDWQDEIATTVPNYIDKTFLLEDIRGVDVVVSYFSENENIAHVFVDFELENDENFGISVETRREIGENFSAFWGIFNRFELIYVVASEDDLVNLRKDVRGEEVYSYRTIATSAQAQTLFLSLASDINVLYENPAFYNTITKNCTNVLAKKVEELTDYDFPLVETTFEPGKLDQVLYEMNLLEGEGGFVQIKEASLLSRSR